MIVKDTKRFLNVTNKSQFSIEKTVKNVKKRDFCLIYRQISAFTETEDTFNEKLLKE